MVRNQRSIRAPTRTCSQWDKERSTNRLMFASSKLAIWSGRDAFSWGPRYNIRYVFMSPYTPFIVSIKIDYFSISHMKINCKYFFHFRYNLCFSANSFYVPTPKRSIFYLFSQIFIKPSSRYRHISS